MAVPVQYFQSIVAIELAVAGALLFQIRFFELRPSIAVEDGGLPHPWIRLLMAVIIGATIFGSLEAMIHAGGRLEAIAVTTGLGLSVLPILIRAPFAGHRRRPNPTGGQGQRRRRDRHRSRPVRARGRVRDRRGQRLTGNRRSSRYASS